MLPLHNCDSQRADIFSRAALETSFTLLRRQHPRLALAVQNQLQNPHWPGTVTATGAPPGQRHHSDRFFVRLDAQVVGQIVAALTEVGTHYLSHKRRSGSESAMLRDLMRSWIRLGEWMIHQAETDYLPGSRSLNE